MLAVLQPAPMPRFGIIPARAISDRRLTDAELRVLAAIGIHVDALDGSGCFASAGHLADEAGVGRSTFYRAADRLIELGYVTKRRRYRDNGSDTSSIYAVLLEEPQSISRNVQESQGIPPAGPQVSQLNGTPPVPAQRDTHNAPINASSPSSGHEVCKYRGTTIALSTHRDDVEALIERVEKIGANTTAWLAEMKAAVEGMHGPPRTPEEIGQAARDFNASGADLSLRLFRGYLRGNGSGESLVGFRAGAGPARRGGKMLAAATIIAKLRKANSVPNPYSGGMGLQTDWRERFTEGELKVVDAFTTRRILDSSNDSALTSQLAKALEELQ